MIVPPDEEVVFDLNCTPLGAARLVIPAGAFDKDTVVTFACTNEVPKVTGTKVKRVISEGYEIIPPEDTHFRQATALRVTLPYDWATVDDVKDAALYEQEQDGDWEHATAKAVLVTVEDAHGSYEKIDYFTLAFVKPGRVYAVVVDKK